MDLLCCELNVIGMSWIGPFGFSGSLSFLSSFFFMRQPWWISAECLRVNVLPEFLLFPLMVLQEIRIRPCVLQSLSSYLACICELCRRLAYCCGLECRHFVRIRCLSIVAAWFCSCCSFRYRLTAAIDSA